jgi:hypothetical protein
MMITIDLDSWKAGFKINVVRNRSVKEMNLYEIENEILNCVDEETGEVLDIEALDNLIIERERKVENLALWIKNLRADAEAFEKEKNTFAARQKSAENKAESLLRYLQGYLAGEKFKSQRVSISYRTSTRVEVLDPAALPKDYQRVTIVPDKIALKDALLNGETFDGVSLMHNTSMIIK